MWLKISRIIPSVLLGLLLLASFFCGCQRQNPLKTSYPSYFPIPDTIPRWNRFSQSRLALGKALFFETQLSADGKTSCASCHKPEFWFSDTIALSKSAFSDTVTLRNTPPIFNLAWKKAFFWDGGVKNLESLSFAPLQSHLEMRADMKTQIPILNKRVQYKALAHEAYHTDTLNSQQ